MPSVNRAPQPPWVNPPSVSSSGEPSPCMTPSTVRNSTAVNVRIVISFDGHDPDGSAAAAA